MKFPLKKNYFFKTSVLLLFVSFFFANPKVGQAQDCPGSLDPNICCWDICNNAATLKNHCVAVSGGYLCYCSQNSSGYTIDAYIYCGTVEGETLGFAGKDEPEAKILSEKEMCSNPIISFGNPYTESPGCAVYAGKKPLILKTEKDKKTKKKSSAMTLCEDGCDKPMQWAFKQVDAENPMKGFYVCSTGKKEECLCWDEENGLSLAERPKEAKKAEEQKKDQKEAADEKSCMIWHVGLGEIKDKEVIDK